MIPVCNLSSKTNSLRHSGLEFSSENNYFASEFEKYIHYVATESPHVSIALINMPVSLACSTDMLQSPAFSFEDGGDRSMEHVSGGGSYCK